MLLFKASVDRSFSETSVSLTSNLSAKPSCSLALRKGHSQFTLSIGNIRGKNVFTLCVFAPWRIWVTSCECVYKKKVKLVIKDATNHPPKWVLNSNGNVLFGVTDIHWFMPRNRKLRPTVHLIKTTKDFPYLACVAGVWRGEDGERRREFEEGTPATKAASFASPPTVLR